jgi:hypothetical protein
VLEICGGLVASQTSKICGEALVPEACQPPDEAPPRGGRRTTHGLALPKADATPNLRLGIYIRCDIRGEDEDGGSLIFLFSPSIYFIYANDPEFFY